MDLERMIPLGWGIFRYDQIRKHTNEKAKMAAKIQWP